MADKQKTNLPNICGAASSGQTQKHFKKLLPERIPVNRIPNTVFVRHTHQQKYNMNKRIVGIQEKNNVVAIIEYNKGTTCVTKDKDILIRS
jgi:hypothetical protein